MSYIIENLMKYKKKKKGAPRARRRPHAASKQVSTHRRRLHVVKDLHGLTRERGGGRGE
jgi:hypothetical protein